MAELDLSEAAEALFAWNTPTDPFFVIGGRSSGVDTDDDDPYVTIVRAVAPIIERQVREMVAAEREQIDRFPAQVESFGVELAALPDPDVARIGRALIGASRLIQGGIS